MYKIVISKEGEPHLDSYSQPRTDWANIYEQHIEDFDVAALAVWLNSQPKKRSHKKKEAQ